MARFFIVPETWPSADFPVELLGDEARHLTQVLRIRQGEEITLFDGQGHRATAEVIGTARHAVQLRIKDRRCVPRSEFEMILVQAVPKGKNMDLIVQKAVELGVSQIFPVITQHTVVQPGDGKASKWRRVALEACKQCGQDFLPEIHDPQKLTDFLENQKLSGLQLIASLAEGAQPFGSHFPKGHTQRKATILIGPEGDFTPEETSLALARGFQPISLGSIVLRVETAALYCLSVLRHELEPR